MTEFESGPLHDKRVRVGHAAVLEFPMLESVPEPSVTWLSEDNDIQLHDNKYAVTLDNNLVILSVDSTDEKRYR